MISVLWVGGLAGSTPGDSGSQLNLHASDSRRAKFTQVKVSSHYKKLIARDNVTTSPNNHWACI